MENNTVFVDVIRSKIRRKQPWRWVAKSGDNFRKLAVSGESYTNHADAINAIFLLFGDNANVFLRESEKSNVRLRRTGE